nr:Smr/MutS family protein [uncultured Sphingomonas sp.]
MARHLSPDEQALWAKVTATIRPLSRNKATEPPIELTPHPAPVKAVKGRVPPSRSPDQLRAPAMPIQHRTLDGGWDRRIRSGQVMVDRVLDLHGHSLDRAWEALDTSLDRAIAAGDRVILLVTGHERRGEPPIERGKIRAVIHDWLAHSRHSGAIAAVRSAHKRHGGGGSLYIILRR